MIALNTEEERLLPFEKRWNAIRCLSGSEEYICTHFVVQHTDYSYGYCIKNGFENLQFCIPFYQMEIGIYL